MHRIVLGVVVLLGVGAAPSWSQQDPPPRMDGPMRAPQGPPPGMDGPMRVPQGPPSGMDGPMRAQLEQRFAERVREELHLTDDQAARLRTAVGDHTKRREALGERARALRAALAEQLQPGVAADNDSVARLTDELVGLRLRYAEGFRREWQDISKILSPVQRARFLVMQERMLRKVREIRERRETTGDRRSDRRNRERKAPRHP